MLRVLIAGIALACVACGGAPEPEPARCRDPAGIFFEQVERGSTCGDDRIERPTEDCMHTIVTFNRETCEVQAVHIMQLHERLAELERKFALLPGPR